MFFLKLLNYERLFETFRSFTFSLYLFSPFTHSVSTDPSLWLLSHISFSFIPDFIHVNSAMSQPHNWILCVLIMTMEVDGDMHGSKMMYVVFISWLWTKCTQISKHTSSRYLFDSVDRHEIINPTVFKSIKMYSFMLHLP